ncbi:MAG: GNAT family N-acetyltransferase [Planctomycetia bacterium]|nr:GNAT family N-acetyltransferase [Planctomycetia bacterium]
MQVVRLSSTDELLRLRDAWNALAGGVPFRAWEWCYPWWWHYCPDSALLTLALRDKGGVLRALVPWHLQTSPARGRVVRFFGSGETCADYQTILVRPADAAETAVSLAEWLTIHARDWDLLEWDNVEADDPALSLLADELSARGHVVRREPALNCWRLTFPESWEAYESRLSKSHRKQMRRHESRLFDTGRAVLHTVGASDTPSITEQFDRAYSILVELHQKHWQHRQAAGVFASRRFLEFHRDAARKLLSAGRLRLHWLELDGLPIAAEYHLTGDGVVYAYQSGVDPDCLDVEPGALVTLATIKLAFRDGFRAIDFLRGDEPYKAHWRARPRPCVSVRVVCKRPAARVRNRAWESARSLKRWWAGTAPRPASAPLHEPSPEPAAPIAPAPSVVPSVVSPPVITPPLVAPDSSPFLSDFIPTGP